MLDERQRRWQALNHFRAVYWIPCDIGPVVAVSSSPRPWIDVFVLNEKSNMAMTWSDSYQKVRKMS